MKDRVIVSAPGKIIIMGEHAVVYGRPCLVVAVNKRITLSLQKNATDEWLESSFISEAVKVFKEAYSLTQGVKIIPQTEFPRNLGLGSSSAVTVATIYGLSKLFLETDLSPKNIFDLAFKVVRNVQGVSSGFDVAAAIYGGVIYYKNRGEIINPFTKVQIPIIVAYTGSKVATVSMVKKVSNKRSENQIQIDAIFNKIADLVERGKIALFEEDWESLGSLMNLDQVYLTALGVSSDQLDQMIKAAVTAGAYGAKLSGAGGGNCMIALVSKEKEMAVKEAVEKTGGQIIELAIETEGVKENEK